MLLCVIVKDLMDRNHSLKSNLLLVSSTAKQTLFGSYSGSFQDEAHVHRGQECVDGSVGVRPLIILKLQEHWSSYKRFGILLII